MIWKRERGGVRKQIPFNISKPLPKNSQSCLFINLLFYIRLFKYSNNFSNSVEMNQFFFYWNFVFGFWLLFFFPLFMLNVYFMPSINKKIFIPTFNEANTNRWQNVHLKTNKWSQLMIVFSNTQSQYYSNKKINEKNRYEEFLPKP